MKLFILCTILVCNIATVTYTKTLQEKSWKITQEETWATHCRKRKTDKNKKVYATPASTQSIIQTKSHSITKIDHSICPHDKQVQTPAHIKKVTARVSTPRSVDLQNQKKISNTRKDQEKIETLQPALADSEPILPEQPPVVISDIAAIQNIPSTQTTTRTITVKNGVTKKMRTYKHWGTSHEPTFTLRANGIEIPQKGQAQVTLIDNELNTDYHADFYGMRTSSDKANFIVDADTSEITITFGWDKNPRIVIDSATVMQEK